MAWRVAESLQQLLRQLNALAPKRSKVSDGSIGDAAHASRSSDHNPWFKIAGQGIVTARDFTHDPKNGLDGNKLAEALVRSGDPRIKYIIWNRRIWQNGRWTAYNGSNPHSSHLHLSVVASARADSAAEWNLPGLSAPSPSEDDVQLPTLQLGDGTPKTPRGIYHWAVASAQALLNMRGLGIPALTVDGVYGQKTADAVKVLQKRWSLPQTGVIDAKTWPWVIWNEAPDFQ